jgi:NADPH:quinone reductase-like Zn-dependent oxidoreductase
VQLALLCGALPIALSRTPAKRIKLEALGARHVFDPSAQGLPALIRSAARGRGVDVILDLVGASAWQLSMEVLAAQGRLVLVGTLGGATVQADLSVLMRKRTKLMGTVLRSRPIEEKIALAQAFTRRIAPGFDDGTLRPIVDRVLPFESIAAAHAVLERDEAFGKVVLRMEP